MRWCGLIRPPQLQHSDTDSGDERTATWLELFFDLRLVGEAVGDSHVRLATEEELSRDVEGYQLGALAPLGALAGDNVYRSRGAAARQWWLRLASRR